MTDQLVDLHKKYSEEWVKFSALTLTNLQEIESNMQEVEKKRNTLEDTVNNIKSLSQHAQAKSFIKICPRAYVAATIKHTGEYNVEMNSEYQCTLTKEQTIDFLEEQIAEQNGTLESYKIQKDQLKNRLGFDLSNAADLPDLSDMPEKITSEKGVAFKQGPFYEIMEVESEVPFEKNKKRISRVKQKN